MRCFPGACVLYGWYFRGYIQRCGCRVVALLLITVYSQDAAPEQDSAVQHRRQLLQRNAGLVTVLLDLLGMTTELLGAAA